MTRKNKALQKFNLESVKQSSNFSTDQAIEFLEQFRLLAGIQSQRGNSKLISLKVPEPLLWAFKNKAARLGRPYQSLIKELMIEWLSK